MLWKDFIKKCWFPQSSTRTSPSRHIWYHGVSLGPTSKECSPWTVTQPDLIERPWPPMIYWLRQRNRTPPASLSLRPPSRSSTVRHANRVATLYAKALKHGEDSRTTSYNTQAVLRLVQPVGYLYGVRLGCSSDVHRNRQLEHPLVDLRLKSRLGRYRITRPYDSRLFTDSQTIGREKFFILPASIIS